jgi:Flp pilus assembly protein TadD
MKQYLQLLVLMQLLSFTGCASFGGNSWVPSLWKPTPKTDQFGNTIQRRSWFGAEPKKFGEDDMQLVASEPLVPKKLFQRKPTEDEKQAKLTEQMAMGNSYEQSNQWEKARKLYEQLSKDHPQSSKVKHRMAVVSDRLKRHVEAQRLYREAIDLDPENAQLYNDLGYCYFLQGNLSESEKTIAKAVAMAPNTTRFHNNLGMVYGHQQKYKQALQEFREAGSDADAYFNLAFVYASQEKTDEAKACFQKALAADPAHSKSRDALASFDRYERTPAELRDDLESFEQEGNSRWVAFVEGEKGDSDIMQASATSEVRNSSAVNAKQMQDNQVQPAGGLKSLSSNRYATEQSRRLQSARPAIDFPSRNKAAMENVP